MEHMVSSVMKYAAFTAATLLTDGIVPVSFRAGTGS